MVALAVPSYIWSGDQVEWAQLLAARPAIAVINPNSGPGATRDLAVLDRARQLRGVGCKVLGYVDTKYGELRVDQVLADARLHRTFYGVEGIFWDQITLDTSNSRSRAYTDALIDLARPYVATVAGVVRPGTAALNPGVAVAGPSRMLQGSVWVSYEGPGSTYTPVHTARPYREWHIVHSVESVEQARGILILAQIAQIGYLYMTRDAAPNPYDSFDEELAQMIAAVATPSQL